jgi:acetylglutamate kinase
MEQLVVVKIGGNVIDNEKHLDRFLSAFAEIDCKKVLIHGGGKIATAIGDKLGIPSKYENGRRITDYETLSLVTMVYGGLVNKNIVARLQCKSCNAIGLTGADGNLVRATKRATGIVDYGFVGDVEMNGVNKEAINLLLQAGLVPVVAPLTHDGSGSLLNTNADTIAQEIAKAMAEQMQVKLIYCFEKKGLLLDVNDEESVIKQIDGSSFERLKAKAIIADGMIPKLENAFEAVRQKVSAVVLGHADDLKQLLNGSTGTQIIL